ncbi:hypothetical protein CR513_60513, partial [Mucuna pruriens]
MNEDTLFVAGTFVNGVALSTLRLEDLLVDLGSKIESSPTLSHPFVSEFALSRDSVGYNLVESISDPSLPRASRSSFDPLHALDPEIEITLLRLRKVRHTVVSNSSSFNFVSNSNISIYATNEYDFSEYSSSNANSNFVFGELATPDVVYQPWCIQYSQLEPAQSYELKSGLIHLLPKFHGLAVRSQGIPEDYIKMKAFPFSLDGAAKDWLYLQPILSTPWET